MTLSFHQNRQFPIHVIHNTHRNSLLFSHHISLPCFVFMSDANDSCLFVQLCNPEKRWWNFKCKILRLNLAKVTFTTPSVPYWWNVITESGNCLGSSGNKSFAVLIFRCHKVSLGGPIITYIVYGKWKYKCSQCWLIILIKYTGFRNGKFWKPRAW